MFKSPVKTPSTAKRTPISFVRTAGSPRALQVQTAKHISSPQNQISRTNSFLTVQMTLDYKPNTFRLLFPFSSETTVATLITFLHRELREGQLYFTSKSLSIQHFLTLRERRVQELGTRQIQLRGRQVQSRGADLKSLEVIRCLGTGGFSRVYLARGFGRLIAIKVISKTFILQNDKRNIVESEREILEACSGHPFITQLLLSFETHNHLVFGLEYCHGGELFNLLRRVRRMKEQQAKFYFVETLAALAHLHAHNILYRDLKPQNIILDSDGHLRLADYGLSKFMRQEKTHSFCGSAEYMAPEMLLKKGHSFEIDYYCLGALLYELLVGLPPYYSRDQSQLFSNILNSQLQFPPALALSPALRDILTRLLQKDANLRFKSVAQIFAHPWLAGTSLADVLAKKLDPPFKTSLFEDNFDSADFAHDQQEHILKLEKEKERKLPPEQACFPHFYYLHPDLMKTQQLDMNFSKKAPLQHSQSQKQIDWIHGSMRSINNSTTRVQQMSPRTQNPTLSRSSQKIHLLIAEHSHISNNPSRLSPSPSHLHPRESQITNPASLSSFAFECGIQKDPLRGSSPANRFPSPAHNRSVSPINGRSASPININNYINIYTSKPPVFIQPKKTLISNASFDKSSSINHHNPYHSIERTKFVSLEKSSHHQPQQLRNNVYCVGGTDNNRGYLSTFKQRTDNNPKVKKAYRTSDKLSFNFLNGPPYRPA